MKAAIEEILDTVSNCEIDHPVFARRYLGEMDDEEFLSHVDEYLLNLLGKIDRIEAILNDPKGEPITDLSKIADIVGRNDEQPRP